MTQPDEMIPFLRDHKPPDVICPECGDVVKHPSWGCSTCERRATMDLGAYNARISIGGKSICLRIERRRKDYEPSGSDDSVHPGMTPEIARELGRRLMLAADAAKEKQDNAE